MVKVESWLVVEDWWCMAILQSWLKVENLWYLGRYLA